MVDIFHNIPYSLMGETKATEQCDSNPQIHSMKYWLANRDSQFMDDDDDDDDDDPHYI